MARQTPWAVLMCKFKDDVRGFPTINKTNIAALFTAPDIENVVTFWQDVSYGELDLTGSEIVGWLTLDQKQSDYVGSGANPQGRQDLVEWAKQKAGDSGVDLGRYYGVIVFVSTPTDLFGSPGQVVCDLQSSLSQILQEVGHGYGQDKHSRAVASPTTDYTNPYCIMSGMSFGGAQSTFTGRFGDSGPFLCSPWIDAFGWLPPSRIVRVAANGQRPSTMTTRLSPLVNRSARYAQAAVFDLTIPYQATYYVEFRSGGWDRGLAQSAVVVHQRRPDGYAYYAGSVPTSVARDSSGKTLLPGTSWIDPQFDLAVLVDAVLDQGEAVQIKIAPAAAARALSVRTVARSALKLEAGFSVRGQVLRPGTGSVRDSLLALLGP